MSSEYTERDRAVDGLRLIGAGLTIAAAALAVRRLIGGGARAGGGDVESSPPVSKAFTVNRAPDEVAQLWSEIDPLGAIVEHVRFDVAPGNRGTEVHVQFHPRWFGRRSPARVQEQLRQFKQLAEAGEIARAGVDRGVRQFGETPEGTRVEEVLVGGAR
jgi:uncharacterized membrane protein